MVERNDGQRGGSAEVIQYYGVATGRWPQRIGRTTHTVFPIKHMLVTGELTTGFQFYGPFDTVFAAGQWATKNLKPGTPHRVHNMYDVRNGS